MFWCMVSSRHWPRHAWFRSGTNQLRVVTNSLRVTNRKSGTENILHVRPVRRQALRIYPTVCPAVRVRQRARRRPGVRVPSREGGRQHHWRVPRPGGGTNAPPLSIWSICSCLALFITWYAAVYMQLFETLPHMICSCLTLCNIWYAAVRRRCGAAQMRMCFEQYYLTTLWCGLCRSALSASCLAMTPRAPLCTGSGRRCDTTPPLDSLRTLFIPSSEHSNQTLFPTLPTYYLQPSWDPLHTLLISPRPFISSPLHSLHSLFIPSS
jgi:hypothetical protein